MAGAGQYVTLSLGESVYAVPVAAVREIVRLPAVTRLPRAPECVEGLANLRGEVLPVLDLRTRLGLPRSAEEGRKVVILDFDGLGVGIVVDRTSQVLRVEEHQIEHQPLGEDASELLAGVIRAHEAIFMLLETRALLTGVATLERRDRGGEADLGRQAAEEDKPGSRAQVVTFEVGGQGYALPIAEVREIVRYVPPTPLPDTPPWMRGVVNLRGHTLPVVDLRIRLGIPETPVDEFTKVVVLGSGTSRTGFVVDRIHEVLRVSVSDIAPPPPLVARANAAVGGILEVGDRVTVLLRPEVLLEERREGTSRAESPEEALPKDSGRGVYIPLVLFTVEGQPYGVPIEQIREICRMVPVTPIPRSPRFVEGVMNLRGEVLPVVHLGRKMGGGTPKGEGEGDARILVFENTGAAVGFLVDTVMGVERFSMEDLLPPPAGGTEEGVREMVHRVARREDGSVVLVLDLGAVLSPRESVRVGTLADRSAPGAGTPLPEGPEPPKPARRLRKAR